MLHIRKIVQVLTILTFCLVVGAPALKMILTSDQAISTTEKRVLAKAPEFKGNLSPEFVEDSEAYLADHFGFREALVYGYSYWNVAYLNQSPNSTVLVGDDNWLYYALPYSAKDFQGVVQYQEVDKDYWAGTFQYRKDWLAARGIQYILVIAPDKKTIYPEYYPDQYPVINPNNTLTDQFLAVMTERTDLHIIDLRQPLLNYRTSDDSLLLYFKTDTHWNTLGAYLTYRYIINDLQIDYPELPIISIDDLDYGENQMIGGDLALAINLENAYIETYPDYRLDPSQQCAERVPYTSPVADEDAVQQFHCAENNINAVFFHDSFFDYSLSFLSESFGTSVYVSRGESGYYFTPWDWEADMDQLIRDVQPVVVIEEIVERQLPRWEATLDEYSLERE